MGISFVSLFHDADVYKSKHRNNANNTSLSKETLKFVKKIGKLMSLYFPL